MSLTSAGVFRALAARLPYLIAAYGISLTLALLVRDFAADHAVPALVWIAGVLYVVTLSLLFTVFALYRDDGLLLTGLFLTIITGASAVIGIAIASAVQTHSLGPAIMIAVLGPFIYFVRGLVLVPTFAGLVWVARRLRHYLAPDTIEHPDAAA
jgi:hypothetical protein